METFIHEHLIVIVSTCGAIIILGIGLSLLSLRYLMNDVSDDVRSVNNAIVAARLMINFRGAEAAHKHYKFELSVSIKDRHYDPIFFHTLGELINEARNESKGKQAQGLEQTQKGV